MALTPFLHPLLCIRAAQEQILEQPCLSIKGACVVQAQGLSVRGRTCGRGSGTH